MSTATYRENLKTQNRCLNHPTERRPCGKCREWRLGRVRERVAKGLCLKCDQPARDGKQKCAPCAANDVEHNRQMQAVSKAKGECIATGCHRPAQKNRTLCSPCLERLRRAANERRRERQSAGLCVECGKPSELKQARCLTCSSEDRKGLPQPVRYALTEYRKQQEQAQRDAIAKSQRDFIERHIHLIPTERMRQILRMRYGGTEGECLTLEEIGSRYGVTRERVRQLQRFAEERICMFTIEKDIPIPHGKHAGQYEELRQTLMQMDVGDSFVFPSKQSKNSLLSSIAKSLGYIVTTRKASDTERRVWLVSKNGTQGNNTSASDGTT